MATIQSFLARLSSSTAFLIAPYVLNGEGDETIQIPFNAVWEDAHLRLPLQLAPHLAMNGFDATVAYTAIHLMIEKREIIVHPCVTRPFYQVSLTSPPLPAGGQSTTPNPAAGAVTTSSSRGGGSSSRGGGASGGGGLP